MGSIITAIQEEADQQEARRQREALPRFTIKDSGKRESFASGMVRDTATDKVTYSLIMDGPMFSRWAVHLTNGAKKYAARNWMLASGQPELDRFRESALRHFIQWFRGDRDEDHAAAVYFNINGAEYVEEKINAKDNLQSGTDGAGPNTT